MIIEHVMNAGVTDTDKLSDVEAMIMEKSEELRKLCFDSHRQCLILVDPKGAQIGSVASFWNFRTTPEKTEDDEQRNKDFQNLMSCINVFVLQVTGGMYNISLMRKV
jgi:hypothetical protein